MRQISSAVILALVLEASFLCISSCAIETSISVIPADFEVLPGGTFTVTLKVSNVKGLHGWQVALKYNLTVINCTAAWIPDDNVFAGKNCITPEPSLNGPTIDEYNYSVFANSLITGAVDVSEATLAKVNFTVQAYGLTSLLIATKDNPVQFSERWWDIWYFLLQDSNLQEMPFTAESGSVVSGTKVTFVIKDNDGGTTDPSPGDYAYLYGTNVSVTAIPDSYHLLDYWLLDGNNIGSKMLIAVLMTANHTLQPVFVRINYTLTLSTTTGGTTNPSPGEYKYSAGETVEATASAFEDYRFDHWILEGSSSSSANPIGVFMDNNRTLRAVFSQVHFTGTIYIRADGSIAPSDVPISTSDNLTYTFSEDIADSMIVVQRGSIMIDGNGHALQGGGSGEGISLYGVSNVTIRNINIRGFDVGVHLFWASQNLILKNNITENNWLGIRLYYSSNNTIVGNDITANRDDGIRLDYSSDHNRIVGNNIISNHWLGIYLDSSSDNIFCHNNMLNNTNQVHVEAHDYALTNAWDNGFEGNYWSNYGGHDSNLDGIGDTTYVIDANNTDHYPLTAMYSSFDISMHDVVSVISNSTITEFHYSESDSKITFRVEGKNGTIGFCRIGIPHQLMNVTRMQVIVDDGATELLNSNYNVRDNGTHRWISFVYKHSVHKVVIQEDITPPAVLVLSPENRTYSMGSVSLTLTTSEPTSWIGYSLDGKNDVTIIGNTTINGILDGVHYVTVYANDTVGNMGSSDTIIFTIDTTPPNITEISQAPLKGNVSPVDRVMVNATVADNVSGVRRVTLVYAYSNGTGIWNGIANMTNFHGNVWNGTIPAFPYGTNVTYTIIAEDNVGNTITTGEMGIEYGYDVISEFPSLLILPFFLFSSLAAFKMYRRKRI